MFGKNISKSGLSGFVKSPVSLISTSVGIFLLKLGLSRSKAGLAPPGTLYVACIFIWAPNGSPSQIILPPCFNWNFLSINARFLKL